MLYTIVPPEVIFDEDEEPTEAHILSLAGRSVSIRRNRNGDGYIDRLLSTDPNDYLNPRWQPGTPVAFYDW